MVVSDRKLTKPIASATTYIFLITAIIVVALVVLFHNPKITGRYFAPAEDFSASINEKFTSNSDYTFEIPQEQPYNLKALKISGSFSGEGSAKVFLKTGNETYLVFDSSNLVKSESLADAVTGALTEVISNPSSSSSDTTSSDVGSSGESSDSQESAEPASPPSSEQTNAQEESVPDTTDQGEAGAELPAPAQEQPANETQPTEIPPAEGNVSTTENVTAEEIVNKTLPIEITPVTFTDSCEQSCLLPDGLADNTYTLEIQVENGELSISEISYSLQNLTDIPVNITIEIVDSNGQPVAADIALVDDSGKSVVAEETTGQQTIANEIFAPPANEISAEGNMESFETAPSDENNLVVDVQNTSVPIQSIEFKDIDATSDVNAVIGIDDVPEANTGYVEVYAIDPTELNFTEATVTVTATGSALYKCASWDFENQTCTDGNWTFVQEITPGQPYEVTLTASDPAYGETGAAPTISFVSPTPSDGNTTTNNYVYVNASSTDESSQHYAMLDWDSALVGWWRLEETSGTSFTDDSGSGNTGSCSVCPTYNSSGVFNGSYDFDSASSQYIQVTYNEDFNFTTAMTISLWFKYRNSQSAGLVSNRAASSSSYNLYISTTNLIFDVANATTHKATSTYPISTNTWYHAVGVYNGSSINLYINGTLVRTQAQTGDVQDQSFNILIGRYQASYLNGSIDDVMMFRRALSSSEVLALYNATANQYYNNFTGLSYGNYTFKGYAVDTAGNKANTETRTVTLHADSTPPASVTSLANQSRSQTWIYWNWTNPADADFSQAIIYLNGSNVANTSNNYYNATSLQNFTDYTLTVHTKDTNGNINNTDVNSTARTLSYNNIPVSTTPAITPAIAYTNDDLNCTFTITDADAVDTLTANYTWYNGSTAILSAILSVTNGTENSVILAAGNTTKTETWNCSVIPYDGNDYGTAKSVARTITNSLPSAPVVDVIPNVPADTEDLVATITSASTDLDNDSINYAYQWYKNDVLQVGQTANTLSNLLTTIGDVWKCVVTPNDGTGNGAIGQDNVTISALPDTTAPVITISSPTNGSQLSAGTTSTTIEITTNEDAICRYNTTNSTFAYADGTNFTNTDSTNHNFTYAGLSNGQTYTLYYKCNDTSGNVNNVSTMHSFSVASAAGGNNGNNGGGGGGTGVIGNATAEAVLSPGQPKDLDLAFGGTFSYAASYSPNTVHTIRLSGMFPDYVELTITSAPVKVNLELNETKDVDANYNGESDIEITLIAKTNTSAKLRIIILVETVPVSTTPPTETTPAGLEIPSSPPEPLSGAAVQVSPYKAPNPLYAVPTLLLLILVFAIAAMRKENLPPRLKNALTALHIALIITIIILLIFTFVKTPLTGATVAVTALQTTIPADKLVLGIAVFLAGLAVTILAVLFHHVRHGGKKIKL